jgi:hypothetical protein
MVFAFDALRIVGDAADKVFDVWYDSAREFAQGHVEPSDMKKLTIECCSTLLVLHLPTFLTNPNTDDYVVRNLMDNFIKILTLHREKPKFRVLLFNAAAAAATTDSGSDDVNMLSNWLRDIALPKLASLCSLFGISETNRIHYLRAFGALAKVDNELKKLATEQHHHQQQHSNTTTTTTTAAAAAITTTSANRITVSLKCEKYLATLLSVATDVHHSQLYRAAAFDVLRLLNAEYDRQAASLCGD